MGHPLIDRLTADFAYPLLQDPAALDAFTAAPGAHVLFVPGDAARNLETPDVAVILPELRAAFQQAFDCAVVGDALEKHVREATGVFKTPSLILYRDGRFLGGIPKVRDWSDYVARLSHYLAPATA
ncbi:MAG: hydrogenase accessory protein [Rhodobacteraceae bacterium]|nr:hydrogenase accessory protein [Paracoccaceae bacterium]